MSAADKLVLGLRATKLVGRGVKNVLTVKDFSQNLLDNLDFMKKPELLVGIPGDEDQRLDGGETGNAELGHSFEFGSAALNRPATPWLVPGVEAAMDPMIKVMKAGAEEGVEDKQAAEKALNKAGLIAVSTIKRRIVQQVGLPTPSYPPGKKYMIDTAQLLSAVNYVIEK
jgi:hypothetical protein